MSVTVIGSHDRDFKGQYINTTSHSKTWSRELSPFVLGPVTIPYGAKQSTLDRVNEVLNSSKSEKKTVAVQSIIDQLTGTLSCNIVENAWQYSKVYECHNSAGEPTDEWFTWRLKGLKNTAATRHPFGKNNKALYSWWAGRKLSISQARREIYIPLYSSSVRNTEAYRRLQGLHMSGQVILWDFDSYNHKKLEMSFNDVIENEEKSMGHAFVLAMMLEGVI